MGVQSVLFIACSRKRLFSSLTKAQRESRSLFNYHPSSRSAPPIVFTVHYLVNTKGFTFVWSRAIFSPRNTLSCMQLINLSLCLISRTSRPNTFAIDLVVVEDLGCAFSFHCFLHNINKHQALCVP